MPVSRYAKRPKPTSAPRREIDASLHTRVNASLKAARRCVQQITPLESCLQDEMRILERLYYKNANQHRAALFWQRVQEVRRLGRRVLEAQVLGLLDDLRYSFYIGEDAERNPKVLRGAWAQVPNAESLNFVYERLKGLIELLATAKERLTKAYHALSLMMQTGAFLQLILMLTAIVSRANSIIEEIDSGLQSFLDVFKDLLEALGLKGLERSEPRRTEDIQDRLQRPQREDRDIDENHGEDLGSTVVRKTPGDSSKPPLDTPIHAASTPPFRTQQDEESMAINEDSIPLAETPSIIFKVEAKSADIPASKSRVSQQAKPGVISSAEALRVKKKKRRRDEIDDIFGSL